MAASPPGCPAPVFPPLPAPPPAPPTTPQADWPHGDGGRRRQRHVRSPSLCLLGTCLPFGVLHWQQYCTAAARQMGREPLQPAPCRTPTWAAPPHRRGLLDIAARTWDPRAIDAVDPALGPMLPPLLAPNEASSAKRFQHDLRDVGGIAALVLPAACFQPWRCAAQRRSNPPHRPSARCAPRLPPRSACAPTRLSPPAAGTTP